MSKIVALDVESPNQRRICSIGITIIEDGIVKETLSYLVNPECEFNKYTINEHGIHPEDVADAITFDKLWPKISNYFCDSIIVGHNALYDLSVLYKTLIDYNIEVPQIKWICTQRIAERILKQKSGLGLDALCQRFSISLKHHDSGSDSRACAELLLLFAKEGIVPEDEAKTYIYQNHSSPKSTKRTVGLTISLPSPIPYTKNHNYNLKTIRDKTIVITGKFEYADKDEIKELLNAHGARIIEKVSKQVDVVLVGALGDPRWKNGNYGNKIKDAIDFKSKGDNIDIIHENSFEFSEDDQ